MRSISTAFALAGLSLLAAGCTVNNTPDRPTTVVAQPAPAAVVTQPGAVVTTPNTTYVVPRPATTVVTPSY
ncbi:hypothetical protein [Inquilinus limosus]|uniref:Uncharacterized protein n=1 Tax=Inquilinus limosus MP06 TaxID=1398085 RepID=A0A0A0D9S1_9PROT|nr:hypothetical protein [Inquilinus limosus]KGM35471.1 hypothetical protein P409_04280 [Inquilinus limosus MP06]